MVARGRLCLVEDCQVLLSFGPVETGRPSLRRLPEAPACCRGFRAQHGSGLARYLFLFIVGRELLEGKHSPGICRCRVPVPLSHPAQSALCDAGGVLLPGVEIDHGKQRSRRVHIRGHHEPPQAVSTLRGETHEGPLQVEARAQDLLRRG